MKVINKHLFDTDTVYRVATREVGNSVSCKTDCVRSLFRKETEEEFLRVKGEFYPDISNDAKSTPFSAKDTKDRVENSLSDDVYMNIFAEVAA